MPNQNKPISPLADIAPHILQLWKSRLMDKQIVQALRKKIDTKCYGIGFTKFIQVRTDMGLLRTHQQGHTMESICDTMLELRGMYPKAGMREIISLLHHEEGMSVSRSVIKSYFTIYEADLVCQQRPAACKGDAFGLLE
ncbi:hypothetical protein C8R48DRAFT_769413 [Suillus tomentosus]|nr:hypothetical protein C8R48DRAFT_769413 [Suillus tomentosus]